MARWLAILVLCCGLAVVGTGGYGQAEKPTLQRKTQKAMRALMNEVAASERSSAARQCDDPPKNGRSRDSDKRDSDKRGEGRRGPPHEMGPGWASALWWRRASEAVRRDGGSLELLPLLRAAEARKEMGLDEDTFKAKLDEHLAEMQKRFDTEIKQAKPERGSDWAKVFSSQLEKENIEFQKLLDELTDNERDRLIGLFIQARGYRAVSNQLVSAKLGLTSEQATKKRKEIDNIREETIEASRDRVRRIFDKGDHELFEKVVQENQKKIETRIEDSLTTEQRQKLSELRGKEVDEPREWLTRSVDMRRLPPLAPSRDVSRTDAR